VCVYMACICMHMCEYVHMYARVAKFVNSHLVHNSLHILGLSVACGATGCCCLFCVNRSQSIIT